LFAWQIISEMLSTMCVRFGAVTPNKTTKYTPRAHLSAELITHFRAGLTVGIEATLSVPSGFAVQRRGNSRW
jgi:hypothetical protein